ncbi:hypothetical protein APR41_04340 [Salegentibacter salinarum]|uniref:Outer membrane protein beta-barrel domain-containing protein n=1 Tax=Salegentibacter salinarum TaxID=447422 RepID=A0A2N0TUJ9_9FLAO|nr:hypothetical protein [Salegentibacter salinarum]PKD18386.1 hypothetical protein APR41_04340 [Salegentibacter salinarum]SKB44922.1 hypothetical protein SAMN05660903_00890 [Salegentibacter salinarum]
MKKLRSSIHLLAFIILLPFSNLEAQEQSETLNNPELSSSNFYTSRYQAQNAFNGLGYYKLYNQTFNYETDKLLITLGAGFLEQNTIFNNMAPGIHGSISANFEYKFNQRFSFYLFGRYLTPSLNEEGRINTPHMELLYPQSEVSAGLRGNFNNVNIDVGASTLFGNQPELNTLLRTKVSIGF